MNNLRIIVLEGALPAFDFDKINEYLEPDRSILRLHVFVWIIVLIINESAIIPKLFKLCQKKIVVDENEIGLTTDHGFNKPVIRVRNLSMKYFKISSSGCCNCNKKGSKQVVLDNINFNVYKG